MAKSPAWIEMYNHAAKNWNDLHKKMLESEDIAGKTLLADICDQVAESIIEFLHSTMTTEEDFAQFGLPMGIFPVLVDTKTDEIVEFALFVNHGEMVPGTTNFDELLSKPDSDAICGRCNTSFPVHKVKTTGCPKCGKRTERPAPTIN